jgi:hypothetical protein
MEYNCFNTNFISILLEEYENEDYSLDELTEQLTLKFAENDD